MGELGERTYQLIVDIGSIFRERLLNHSTEPETMTITIIDPLNLTNLQNTELREIFSKGTKESVFYQEPTVMKPKNSAMPESREYLLNRIYAPALKVSYRSRWPRACWFTIPEVKQLLNDTNRTKTRRILMQRQHSSQIPPKTSMFDELD